jgi:UDP-glucose 4-epimerase
MRYLITGGAGFIGSHLIDALTARGDSVLVLDDLSTGRLSNIEHQLATEHADFIEGSVLDADLVRDCTEQVDGVFHLASAVGVQLIVSKPLETLQKNVRGNDIVISTAAELDKWLLFTSTSEVYGKNSSPGLTEDADRILGSPFKARWAYATAKSFGEALCNGYYRAEGSKMVVVRLFNTVGPRQTGAYGMVLPSFVRQALAGEDLSVYGNGTQTRCFCHVNDTVHALMLLSETELAVGKAFNIGAGSETPIIELARRVIDRAGSKAKIELIPYDEAYEDGFEELGRRMPDTTAIRRLTGWAPSHSIDEAIDDVIAFEQSRNGRSPEGLRLAG